MFRPLTRIGKGIIFLFVILSVSIALSAKDIDPITLLEYSEYDDGFSEHIMAPTSVVVKKSRKKKSERENR